VTWWHSGRARSTNSTRVERDVIRGPYPSTGRRSRFLPHPIVPRPIGGRTLTRSLLGLFREPHTCRRLAGTGRLDLHDLASTAVCLAQYIASASSPPALARDHRSVKYLITHSLLASVNTLVAYTKPFHSPTSRTFSDAVQYHNTRLTCTDIIHADRTRIAIRAYHRTPTNQQRRTSNIFHILDWSDTKSFPHRTTLSLPSWNNILVPCIRINLRAKRDGRSRCWPFEAQPHQESQGLQDLQTQTHSLRRDVPPMVRMLVRRLVDSRD